MRRFASRGAACAAVLGVLALVGAVGARADTTTAAPASSSPACTAHTTVRTHDGPVRGITRHGQTDYLDIRYAAPPVGNLRWAPPQPVTPWHTTYRATRRGRGCASPGFPKGGLAKGTGEDCLFHEVQEPAHVRAGRRGERL